MKSAQRSAVDSNNVAGIRITPISAALGAEVSCGDVRVLDAERTRAIRQAWLDHLVLLFRGQTLNDDELVRSASANSRIRCASTSSRQTSKSFSIRMSTSFRT
jgi:taurine dioxygenase